MKFGGRSHGGCEDPLKFAPQFFFLESLHDVIGLKPYCWEIPRVGQFWQRALLPCTGLFFDRGLRQSKAFLYIREAMNGQVRLRGTPRPPPGVPALGSARSSSPDTRTAHTPILGQTRAPTNCCFVPTLPFVLERLGF